MACSCKKGKTGSADKVKVRLKGGLTVTKNSLAEATAFAAKTPGATVVKSSA